MRDCVAIWASSVQRVLRVVQQAPAVLTLQVLLLLEILVRADRLCRLLAAGWWLQRVKAGPVRLERSRRLWCVVRIVRGAAHLVLASTGQEVLHLLSLLVRVFSLAAERRAALCGDGTRNAIGQVSIAMLSSGLVAGEEVRVA